MLLEITRLTWGTARLATASALGLADAAGSLAAASASRTVSGFSLAGRASEAAAAKIGELADAGLHRSQRRIWAREGRAHVEVRGLTGSGHRHRRLSEDVTSALKELKGVHWAEINAVTQHVLIAFDEDAVDMDLLVEVIESVEEAHGTEEETFSRTKPEHPSADAPVAMAAVALAADVVGLGVALAGRAFRVPAMPPGVRIPLLFVETYPRVRHAVEGRLGRTHAEFLFSVSNATINALTQGPAPLAIDSLHHGLRFAETRSRQAVWHRRERELVGDGGGLPSEIGEHSARPVPLPQGPIEKLGDRTSLATLLGAGGVLALTRDPGRAAELMLATMPKAARHGREAFASTLGWELTRHGVVPMDATVLRRLDRISTVVIDSAALCTTQPRILTAVATDASLSDTEVWQLAEKALIASGRAERLRGPGPWTVDIAGLSRAGSQGSEKGELWRFERAPDAASGSLGGPTALTLDVWDAAGLRRGRVRIGSEIDPLADALLVAARAAADRVVLTEHDSAGDLLPWADEVVLPGAPLVEHIREAQATGGVLVVSAGDDAALHAADVGVAVIREAQPVCWSADLLCGPGLGEVWRILQAVGVARQVSERSARLALGGSALGALLAVTGTRRTGRAAALSPVHSASLVAVTGGAFSALRLGRLELPQPVVRGMWHDLEPEEVLRRLEQARREYAAQVAKPLGQLATAAETGRSVLRSAARLPVVSQTLVTPTRGVIALSGAVAEELRDPLTPVLAFGAAASAVVGSGIDAALVGGVMAGNAVISGGQRLRAERALRRLLIGERIEAHRVEWRSGPAAGPVTIPIRDGGGDKADAEISGSWPTFLNRLDSAPQADVSAEQLRVGDIIKLGPTDVVPADVRLLTATALELDESSLNGESLPVAKSVPATPGADLDERTCMLYEGCTVLAGSGYAVVVATGQDTESGRAGAVAGSAGPPAGIQARLAELTRIALPAAGIGGVAVTGIAAMRGVPLRQAVASGVAIAVAAVPEGLPLVATVAQLAAARRLSRHGVLVRSSRTLEALGRVDTLCFDKTGTLTQNKLSVRRLASADGRYLDFDASEGGHLLRIAARACPADEGTPARPVAHATDGAVLEAARKHVGADEVWNLLTELPFETNRGYAASLGTNTSRLKLAVKGAPETVLAACTSLAARDGSVKTLIPKRREEALAVIARLAQQGLRVLAVAEALPTTEELAAAGLADLARIAGIEDATQDATHPAPDLAALVTRLTLVGFVAIADTPRPTASAAIARLARAGVRITMITGDHPSTAVAIAAQLGIPAASLVLTGAEFDKLRKRDRAARVAATTVFARVSPEQKVRIVQALQEAGRVVAMTGDGANDAAAIRLADVGIAIAGVGSAAARSAADLVLAEPDPALIADALLEGRALWSNVRDAASILVGGNAGEVAFTVLGTALSGRAPLGTRQLLLVNMLTDMLPALAVALAPARPQAGNGDDPLTAGPVSALWGPALARNLAIRGGTTALGATLAWGCGRMSGRQRRASTMGLGALVGTQLGQTLVTARHSPLVVVTAAASALALFAVVETPGVSQFFGCTPLGPAAWGIVLGSSVAATAAGMIVPNVMERFAPTTTTTTTAAAAAS